MFPQILTTAWLTVFYWNNVSSQLLYENDRWNNELFRDSKEASKQYSQEKLEALLKEARLDSDIWRSRHEIVTESYNKLPKICKEHVRNVSKVTDICQEDRFLVFAHPDECQLYYNCSMTYADVPAHLEQHMVECPYPSLFSTKSLRCENFTDVCCGLRTELKDKCDYRLYLESSSTCKQQSPSCIGKTDGYHRGYTSINSFIICFKERFMNTGMCEDDELWNTIQIIYKGQCRNLYEVPFKDGGLLSSCDGKMDGNYANDHPDLYFGGYKDYFRVGRKCDAYYRCQGEVASAVKCPNDTTFDSAGKSCKSGNHSIELGCQLYCNPNFRMFGFPNNLAECPYPEQFSGVTHRCENFTNVTCGSRPQIKEYCSYWITLYTHRNSDSISYCRRHHLNCTSLPDGVYEHPSKRASPDYVICMQGREIGEGTCTRDTIWQEQMYPFNGTCTQRYAIPTSYYGLGLLPNCSENTDGHYEYQSRPCDAYYKCEGRVATAVKCPPDTSFNVDTGICMAGEFFRVLCTRLHCQHCKQLYPSCKEEGNGFFQHPLHGFSPRYIFCKDNRTIDEGYCPPDYEWGIQQFPYNGQCVHLYAIPREYVSSGLLPSCNGKADGNYQYLERCDAYYKCEDGMATAVKCPDNTVFDSSNRTCEIGGICN